MIAPFPPGQLALHTAVSVLHRGGVVACPTEAVWGLSCDPENERAVAQVLALKARPVGKGLILVASSEEQLEFVLSGLAPQQRQALSATWPGPATWLVPHQGRVPGWICGDHATVAVRVSKHPVVSALCAAWGGPLVSTSANRAGARPAREAFQVRRYFGNAVDFLLPGRLGGAERPTGIRDLASGQIVRY
ncbi:MAG: Sua5/YciO/YrdC/YwlC family protein [Halioglobus sp.]